MIFIKSLTIPMCLGKGMVGLAEIIPEKGQLSGLMGESLVAVTLIWQASEASETLSGPKNGNGRYIYSM